MNDKIREQIEKAAAILKAAGAKINPELKTSGLLADPECFRAAVTFGSLEALW